MALRFWHQSTTEIDNIGPYKRSLTERARLILGDEAEIEVQGLPSGTYHGRTRARPLAMRICIIAFSIPSSTTPCRRSARASRRS